MWVVGADYCPRTSDGRSPQNYQTIMALACGADDTGAVEAKPAESFWKPHHYVLFPLKRMDIDNSHPPPTRERGNK